VTVPERLTIALSDRYRLERELGQGGMATVYLAQDLKHDRQVALKVLKPELAAVLGAERFVIEIKTTAALQHPHILPLFDSGTADGFLYYVMPFIQGETLRTKLDREHQFGVDEAVRITRDVADALDYAHRNGVIHRDIKPENILLHDGRPMVADFGIALALSAAAGGRMTETGLSLGTPHYMSPEQATAEKEISGRSDVYSLASVLYEMLTGEPPHTGKSAQQIIMKIIAEPVKSVTELRKSVPPHVAAAVAQALEKLPADRFGSAAEFAAALVNPAFTVQGLAGAGERASARRAGLQPLTVAMAVLAFVATVAAVWFATRPAPDVPTRQFSLSLSSTEGLSPLSISRLALAPDGSSFVYAGTDPGGVNRLMLRPFGQLRAIPLPGTENGAAPSFSPDGTRIAFLTVSPFALKVVALNGAPAITLESQNIIGGGVHWSADDWIYFDGGGSLDRIRGGGGGREVVVALDSAAGEVGYAWPEPLPNGKGLIYRSRRAGETAQRYVLKVIDFRTRESRVLVQGLIGRYSPTGHLLYVTADGVLLAAPFDQDRMELTGPPTPLVEGLGVASFGGVDIALSPAGDLLFVRANTRGGERLSWVRRDGSAELVDPAWTTGLEEIVEWSLSPDGRRLALALGEGGLGGGGGPSDIWVKELEDGPLSKLTFEGVNRAPAWSADGRSILYLSASASDPNLLFQLHRISADGTGSPEPLLSEPRGLEFVGVSPRHDWVVVVTNSGRAGGGDLLAYRPGQDSSWLPLVQGPLFEGQPAISPDGRWLAYVSDEAGQIEVFIRPFPEVSRGKWQVSVGGGFWPRWAHSGAELFYASLTNQFMAAEIRTEPTLSVGPRQQLYGSGTVPIFEVAPDDQRFLRLWAGPAGDSTATELVLIQNIFAALRARR
jgi:serine/threonine-protein kinase